MVEATEKVSNGKLSNLAAPSVAPVARLVAAGVTVPLCSSGELVR